MDEVEVDGQAVQGSEACVAVGQNRLRAPVWDPPAARSRHATFRDDSCAVIRTAAAKRASQQPLVVAELVLSQAIRVRGVEDGDTGLGGGRDRLESDLLVSALVRRHAHAAETDAQLRRR